ncbi:IS110 family transposase [Nocardia sp. NBC_00565]|uniref:IS110 family transposase n=1 Tax=Nocardia sp. NBC_00565 TaxID=2975993 RepID=UPI002E819E8A|nr:IS110 family transposase [Nocardia sp. NBC_00565]WUC06846.1 IS110 family transposase [Nocardia sp. NBC_00565]
MALIADRYEYVIGVDTHARTHTFAIIETRTGAVADSREFPTHRAGTARAITWIGNRTTGSVFAAVEGTSSYGAQLTAALLDAGIPVGEVRPPSRAQQAIDGKSDTIDAETAARSVLRQDESRVASPRAAGDRAALRILLAARRLLDQQRTADRNALTALLRTIDLGVDVRRPVTDAQIAAIAAWRTTGDGSLQRIARAEAQRLARSIIDHTKQLRGNHTMLGQLAEKTSPGLQSVPGIGPVTAAIIICAYSHHGRIRSEAAFAALAGVAPRPASSGNTVRHRLNRGGDRQLNRAFDVIVRTRLSFDADTRAYAERSRAQGKSPREIRRNLKRYVCRAVFRQLHAMA